MNLHWEEMTSAELGAAARDLGGVCVLPLGCVEKHAAHLPLGTDVFVARKAADLAVAREPAVIFPPLFLGWIHDGKHHPGAVALPPDTLLAMLEGICAEIARNGFRKIILLNGHGGNSPFLSYFVWKGMAEKRPYQIYCLRLEDWYERPEDEGILEEGIGHAGEGETSCLLASRPDLARMDRASSSGPARGRLSQLPPSSTGWEWYADWPEHHQGDGSKGSVEKGERLMANMAGRVALAIAAVRADLAVEALQEEFFGRIRH